MWMNCILRYMQTALLFLEYTELILMEHLKVMLLFLKQ